MKTIDEIKDEYAEHLADVFDRDFSSWKEMIDTDFEIGSGICKIYSIEELMEQVAIRYASQFEGRIKELEDMLVRVRKSVDWGYSCWGNDQGFILSEEIDSLINKGK